MFFAVRHTLVGINGVILLYRQIQCDLICKSTIEAYKMLVGVLKKNVVIYMYLNIFYNRDFSRDVRSKKNTLQ